MALHTPYIHIYTQIPSTNLSPGQDDFNGAFYQIFREETMQIVQKFLQKIEQEEDILLYFMVRLPSPDTQPDRGIARKLQTNIPMIIDTKIVMFQEISPEIQFILIIRAFHICEFPYLLKSICYSQANTQEERERSVS